MDAHEYYEKMADEYDAKTTSGFDAEFMPNVVALFKKHNITEGAILDVMCGTGLLADNLGKNFSYTGIDLSGKMLVHAVSRGYTIHEGDALSILKKIPDNSFDHVLCIGGMLWIAEGMELWQHMLRIARKSITATPEAVTPIVKAMESLVPNTKLHDHSNLDYGKLTDDYMFSAWTNPKTGIRVQARMIFLQK